ncbi:MAG: hypothetical protein WD940_01780 [Patescibacteria group bacterium]
MENTNKGTGLPQNTAAALTYLFGFVTGILFLLIEKQNRFVRFHAMQSTVLFGGFFVLNWILWLVPVVDVIWALLSIPMGLALFVLWIYLMYEAYQGVEYKLPVIGDFSAKQLGKLKV